MGDPGRSHTVYFMCHNASMSWPIVMGDNDRACRAEQQA